MRLETKIGLNTSILVCAMLLSATVAHVKIHESNRLSHLMIEERTPVVRDARDLRLREATALRSEESALLVGLNDRAAAQRFAHERDAHWDRAVLAMSHLRDESVRFELGTDDDRIATLEREMRQMEPLMLQARRLDVSRPADRREASSLLVEHMLPLDTQMWAALTGIIESQGAQSDVEMQQLQHANHAMLTTLWTATFFSALVGALFSIALARRITASVERVAERADAIAAGDLSSDELPLDHTAQVARLASAMNRMQSNLGEMIGTLATGSSELATNAASMRGASEGIHRRMDLQNQQTQQAATAMAEMSASIAEVSRHTQDAAQTARDAAKTAHDGGTIVKAMLGSMQQIASAVSETSSTVSLLGEDSRRISQIVTTIDEIAKKTNLLALNAAIEAARAGDHGRGFAVVASEVRRLAESTAQATGEIASMIEAVQQRTRTAVSSMEMGTETVTSGVATTTLAGEALERIIGMAERVDRMIAQIAIAASQQASAADQSSASLDAIHTLSNENLNEMAVTAQGVDGLRATAIAIERQVERFSLGNGAAMQRLVTREREGSFAGAGFSAA